MGAREAPPTMSNIVGHFHPQGTRGECGGGGRMELGARELDGEVVNERENRLRGEMNGT